MGLGGFLGLGATLGAPLTPDQLAALPYVQLPPAALAMQGQPSATTPAPGATPAPAAAPPHTSKLRDFIGHLGDALYTSAGGKGTPMYQRMQTQTALQNYLTDPQGSIARLMQIDAPTAIDLLRANAQARYDYEKGLPPELRDLNAMHVDPASPQGQQMLSAHLGKAPNAVITEFEYYQAHGGRLPFGDFVRLVHPPAGGTLEEQGGDSGAPSSSGGPALRLDPQTGQWVPE